MRLDTLNPEPALPNATLSARAPRWQAVLSGELATNAWAAIEAIREALAVGPDEIGLPADGPPTASLAGGHAGIALWFAYLDQARPGEGHDELALAYLEQAFTECAASHLQPSLYSGFTGVGWVLQHLTGPLVDDAESAAEVDSALARVLALAPWFGQIDLIAGLAGFGVYALERHRAADQSALVGLVLDRLEEVAERQPTGLTWFTPPELLPPISRSAIPTGYYNLGVAHGVPGILGFLVEAHRAGIDRARTGPLVAETVRWLRSLSFETAQGAHFPNFFFPGAPLPPSRTAWCYGDLGVAIVLLQAGLACAQPDWQREAIAIARRAALREPAGSGVVDACLCHGATGVGHLFSRLWQATGEPLFATTARSWYERGLALRQPIMGSAGEGGTGFLTWSGNGQGDATWHHEPGFLTGIAGIGLALLAGVSTIPPSWDRLLLAELPVAEPTP